MRSINTVLPSVRFCTFSFKYLSLTSSGLIFHNGNIIQQGRMPEGKDLASEPPIPEQQVAIPEDIPDPQGDDIVAQQLREAAIAETDPALKEKLWEEYKRYKAGL